VSCSRLRLDECFGFCVMANFSSSLSDSDMCSCKTAKCDKGGSKKPLMIDKSLETERDLVTLDFLVDQDSPNNNFDMTKRDHVLVDLIEKKKADLAEKVRSHCITHTHRFFPIIFFAKNRE
jgi:hypothetical protein